MIVMLATREKRVIDGKCIRLHFTLQKHVLCVDFRVLYIKGYDVILEITGQHSTGQWRWIG
jgi:hypothetical protein